MGVTVRRDLEQLRAEREQVAQLAAELDGMGIVLSAGSFVLADVERQPEAKPLSDTQRIAVARALLRDNDLHTACARALRVYDPSKQPRCAEVAGW